MTKQLTWGSKLCPVCKINEVAYAKQCQACYQRQYHKTYYQTKRGKQIKLSAKERSAARLKAAAAQAAMNADTIAFIESAIALLSGFLDKVKANAVS